MLVLLVKGNVGPIDSLRLVISQGLEGVDNVDEVEPAINVLVKPFDPIDDVRMLDDVLGAIEIGQEYPQIVCV